MTTADPSATAADLADRADEPTVYVLGGGRLGATVARQLRSTGRNVVLLDEAVDETDPDGHRGDPVDPAALAEVDLTPDSVVVVATPSDARNLLVAQLVRTRFDVDRVVVLTNHPERVGPVADAGHEPVCATSVLSEVLVEQL